MIIKNSNLETTRKLPLTLIGQTFEEDLRASAKPRVVLIYASILGY